MTCPVLTWQLFGAHTSPDIEVVICFRPLIEDTISYYYILQKIISYKTCLQKWCRAKSGIEYISMFWILYLYFDCVKETSKFHLIFLAKYLNKRWSIQINLVPTTRFEFWFVNFMFIICIWLHASMLYLSQW